MAVGVRSVIVLVVVLWYWGWKGDLPALEAGIPLSVRATRLALVDVAGVALRGQLLVHSTCHAVSLAARAGTDVQRDATEGTAVDAPSRSGAVLGWEQVAKVGLGEDAALSKVASILGLIPPRPGAVEAALGAQDLLEGPHEVSVPDGELGVAVHVGRVVLVDAHEILVAVRGGGKVARRGLVHQTSDSGYEGPSVSVGVVAPFEPHAGVGFAGCRAGG